MKTIFEKTRFLLAVALISVNHTHCMDDENNSPKGFGLNLNNQFRLFQESNSENINKNNIIRFSFKNTQWNPLSIAMVIEQYIRCSSYISFESALPEDIYQVKTTANDPCLLLESIGVVEEYFMALKEKMNKEEDNHKINLIFSIIEDLNNFKRIVTDYYKSEEPQEFTLGNIFSRGYFFPLETSYMFADFICHTKKDVYRLSNFCFSATVPLKNRLILPRETFFKKHFEHLARKKPIFIQANNVNNIYIPSVNMNIFSQMPDRIKNFMRRQQPQGNTLETMAPFLKISQGTLNLNDDKNAPLFLPEKDLRIFEKNTTEFVKYFTNKNESFMCEFFHTPTTHYIYGRMLKPNKLFFEKMQFVEKDPKFSILLGIADQNLPNLISIRISLEKLKIGDIEYDEKMNFEDKNECIKKILNHCHSKVDVLKQYIEGPVFFIQGTANEIRHILDNNFDITSHHALVMAFCADSQKNSIGLDLYLFPWKIK